MLNFGCLTAVSRGAVVVPILELQYFMSVPLHIPLADVGVVVAATLCHYAYSMPEALIRLHCALQFPKRSMLWKCHFELDP